jgi:hypothetical protein
MNFIKQLKSVAMIYILPVHGYIPRKTFGILHRPSGKFDNKIKIPSWN